MALCFVLAPTVHGQFQMPDARQMSGIPRPVTDLPNGSISVRLVRSELSNSIPNHTLELRVDSTVLTAKTDEAGRAQFDNVKPGATVKAAADVDGEHLESQQFPAPSQGGIRLLLVATDPSKRASSEPGAPPASGQVVIAGNSRILVEPDEEALLLYYLLDITNSARVPVQPTTPFVFDMPSSATECAALEGTSPLARITGTNVRIEGPFPPGSTYLHVACNLPGGNASFDLVQRFPAALQQAAVAVKKVGETRLASPQLTTQQDMAAQGETYIAATGPPVAAGQPFTLSLTNLPHHSPVPRWISLALAAAIVVAGVWTGTRASDGAPGQSGERKRLIARRDRLFSDLVRLEFDRRNSLGDERRYKARREELVTSLEQVYGALDTDGPDPVDRGFAPFGALRAS